jgi:anti-sigma factor RsiW
MAAAYLTIGVALGWLLATNQAPDTSAQVAALPERARLAHVAYLPEVRHPVEVEAKQSAHLAAWLSKRLGTPIRIPALAEHGFELVGGRLLPGDDQHPAAQFMYQSVSGERLTLYVARNHGDEDSAFRYLSRQNQNLLYWIDGELACVLVGKLPRERLLDVANQAYHQLEAPETVN